MTSTTPNRWLRSIAAWTSAFIDTANVYSGGGNERLMAKLLAGRRDEVTLATKSGVASNPADRAAGRRPVRGRRCLPTSVHRRKPGPSSLTTGADIPVDGGINQVARRVEDLSANDPVRRGLAQ